MYSGQKCYGYLNGVQYQVALFPMTYIAITQSPYGTTSHKCSKHGGNSGLWDVTGGGGKQPIYAPFDCHRIAYASATTSIYNGNQCILQSDNKVICADGVARDVFFGFAHDGRYTNCGTRCSNRTQTEAPIISYTTSFKQGDLIGYTGCAGYTCGQHSHWILGKGVYKDVLSSLGITGDWDYCNDSGNTGFISPSPIDIDDLFYANGTQITTSGQTTTGGGATCTWKLWEEKTTTTLTDNPIKQTNNSSYNYIEFNSHVDNPKYSYWVTLVAGGEGQNLGSNINNMNQNVGSEWELIAKMTSGIAFSSPNFYHANGILKTNWTWLEHYDDAEYNSLLAVGGNGDSNTSLHFDLQSNMNDYWGEWAITGVCPLNSSSGMGGVAINSTTGHAFIGQKSDGTIFMGVVKEGTAGSTARNYFNNLGYTGVELDGGGSTFIQYYDGRTSYNKKDSRNLKSILLLYRRTNSTPSVSYYTVSLSTNNENGTAKGSGTYASGTTITIYAIPNDNHKFIKWSDGNTNAERTITVNSNISLTAYFDTGKAGGLIINGYAGIDFQII